MSAAAFKRFVPMMNRVLVQKMEAATKSKSGIILSTKETGSTVGKVIAVGEGSVTEQGKVIPMHAKVGSTVLLPDYGGVKIELADGEFYIYRDSEILGTLDHN